MKALIVIAALACVLPKASMAQRYTVYGRPGVSGSYTRIGLGIAACGPPEFKCSSQSTAVAVSPALPPLRAINATGYAYSSPTDFFYPLGGKGNCITRLTDSSSRSGQSIYSSWSRGASNLMWDTNRAYGSGIDTNGNIVYFHVHYDANGCMQNDSTTMAVTLSGGSGGGFTMSRVTPATAYKLDAHTGTTRTQLYQENLSGTSTVTITRSLLFDYNHCPGLEGTLTTQSGNGNVGVSDDDRYYATTLNFPPAINGQDGAHWVVVWDRQNSSCATWYTGVVGNSEQPDTRGNVWSWCSGNCSRHGSNPAPLALNTTCESSVTGFGMHGNQIVHNGLYIDIIGKCNGISSSFSFWQIGTNNIQTCNPSLNDCGGHEADGYSTVRTMSTNYAIRPVNNLSNKTILNVNNPVGSDYHGSVNWRGIAADTNPEMMTTLPPFGAPCSTAYCAELLAVRLDGKISRFAPTFHISQAANEIGPIAVMTPDGYCMIFNSNWNTTLGLEGTTPRNDLFAICNLQ
jgi:hypothetical protein